MRYNQSWRDGWIDDGWMDGWRLLTVHNLLTKSTIALMMAMWATGSLTIVKGVLGLRDSSSNVIFKASFNKSVSTTWGYIQQKRKGKREAS